MQHGYQPQGGGKPPVPRTGSGVHPPSARGEILASALAVLGLLNEARAILAEVATLTRYDGQPTELARRAQAVLGRLTANKEAPGKVTE